MRSILPVQFDSRRGKKLLGIKEQRLRVADLSGFDFSLAVEMDQVLVSALYKTNEEAFVSWVASYGNINITFKYPPLCLPPPKKPQLQSSSFPCLPHPRGVL